MVKQEPERLMSRLRSILTSAEWSFAGAAIMFEVLGMITDSPMLRAAGVVAFFIFSIWMPVRLLRAMPSQWHRAHPYLLAGSAAVVLIFPAWTYFKCGFLKAGEQVVEDYWNCLYFSAVTWTTVGYGDIHPISWGKLLAACHALIGYMYMALLIGFVLRYLESRSSSSSGLPRR